MSRRHVAAREPRDRRRGARPRSRPPCRTATSVAGPERRGDGRERVAVLGEDDDRLADAAEQAPQRAELRVAGRGVAREADEPRQPLALPGEDRRGPGAPARATGTLSASSRSSSHGQGELVLAGRRGSPASASRRASSERSSGAMPESDRLTSTIIARRACSRVGVARAAPRPRARSPAARGARRASAAVPRTRSRRTRRRDGRPTSARDRRKTRSARRRPARRCA